MTHFKHNKKEIEEAIKELNIYILQLQSGDHGEFVDILLKITMRTPTRLRELLIQRKAAYERYLLVMTNKGRYCNCPPNICLGKGVKHCRYVAKEIFDLMDTLS